MMNEADLTNDADLLEAIEEAEAIEENAIRSERADLAERFEALEQKHKNWRDESIANGRYSDAAVHEAKREVYAEEQLMLNG